MLTTEAKYQALGTTVSYPQKVAEVVAITGAALIQILAGIGVTAGQDRVDRLSYWRDKFQHIADSRVNDAECCSERPAN